MRVQTILGTERMPSVVKQKNTIYIRLLTAFKNVLCIENLLVSVLTECSGTNPGHLASLYMYYI